MIKIASLKKATAAIYLSAAALFAIAVIAIDVYFLNLFIDRKYTSIYQLLLIPATIGCVPGAYHFILLFLRLMSRDDTAIWIKNGKLFYISENNFSIELKKITSISESMLRRGFGLQNYIVVKSKSGQKMYIHTNILNRKPSEIVSELYVYLDATP